MDAHHYRSNYMKQARQMRGRYLRDLTADAWKHAMNVAQLAVEHLRRQLSRNEDAASVDVKYTTTAYKGWTGGSMKNLFVTLATVLLAVFAAPVPASGETEPATYEGETVSIGLGSAHTIVRTDLSGKPTSIGVVFTPSALEGLPKAGEGGHTHFAYFVPTPTQGPRTMVDHVVIDWESAGHPPLRVYDVPHFDFHFYLVSRTEQTSVTFANENESGKPAQQPPAELLAAGYVVPPGTAVPQMGVHAVNPSAAEFHGQPFSATLIYGYYNKRLTFIEPMASLAYLKSKPSFSAGVPRPAAYTQHGAYPSSYSVRYDPLHNVYEVTLEKLS